MDNKIFERLCAIRKAYDETGNLVTALHYSLSLSDKRYKNLLPPLVTLNQEKQKELLEKFLNLNDHLSEEANDFIQWVTSKQT